MSEINKYKVKKQLTEHVEGMEVAEADSKGLAMYWRNFANGYIFISPNLVGNVYFSEDVKFWETTPDLQRVPTGTGILIVVVNPDITPIPNSQTPQKITLPLYNGKWDFPFMASHKLDDGTLVMWSCDMNFLTTFKNKHSHIQLLICPSLEMLKNSDVYNNDLVELPEVFEKYELEKQDDLNTFDFSEAITKYEEK